MIAIRDSAIIATGEETYIKKLERKHVDIMQEWGRHSDPLFYCYNFPYMNTKESDYWYKTKTLPFLKRCFVVFNNNNQLVGYISLRDIKLFRRTSELGIVFDPDEISQGYGSDGLKAFLNYYFGVLKMKALYLKVSAFNKRAQRCYEKCGFKSIGIILDEFEDQSLPIFKDDYFIAYRQFFKQERNKIKCQFINMVITKDMYIGNQGKK